MTQLRQSMRVLARVISGPGANQQADIEDSLEETLDQHNAGSAGTEPAPKASKSTKKRKTPVKKSSTAKPRQRSKRTAAAALGSSSGQDSASLESPDGQDRKRKRPEANLEGPLLNKVSTRDVDQESVLSELSVLSATPEHPGLIGDEFLEEQPVVVSEDVGVDTVPAAGSALDTPTSLVDSAVVASNSPPAATPEQPGSSGDESLDEQPSVEKDVVGVDAITTVDPELDTYVNLNESAAVASGSPPAATPAATPEPPELLENESPDEQPSIESEIIGVEAITTVDPEVVKHTTLVESAAITSSSPLAATPLTTLIEQPIAYQTPLDSTAEQDEAVSHDPGTPAAGPSLTVHLSLSPADLLVVSQRALLTDQSLDSQDVSDPAASLPTPASSWRSVRTVKPPVRFREPADVSAESLEGESIVDEDDVEVVGDSPAVQKAARKSTTKSKPKTRLPSQRRR
jgi:hypothetical protein